jgi:KipI family sensor histidine kinase inhibitor
MDVRFLPAGDRGLVVEFGNTITLEINAAVRALALALERARVPGIRELVPTYRSLGVEYDPAEIAWEALTDRIRILVERLDPGGLPPARVVEIPTCYGGEFGPDLPDVAAHTGLTPDEVIRLHSQTQYPVYMIGITAGFAYLGGLPEALHTPRLTSPRTRVPKGSVAIGGGQTGAYAEETPGGWRLIGRTPVPLFDPLRDPPTPVLPGDRVHFVPIDLAEYQRLESRAPSAESREACATRSGTLLSAPDASLEVVQAGAVTTVQDRGRVGYQKFGVSASGAVDAVALRVANLLVGNPQGSAGLEFTGYGPTLRFLADRVVALTGGEFEAEVAGRPAPWRVSFLVRAGQTLAIRGMRRGLRGYLAVAGGIAVPRLLESAATCLPARFGGHCGRRLEDGDRLATGTPAGAPVLGATAPDAWGVRREEPATVRVVLGPQDDAFTEEGRRTFLSATYRVTDDVDRMGCRLDGPSIAHRQGADIISDWIPMGGVQVPGSGKPIVLLSDRQTTGGYTKLATVIGPDIGRIAQCRPGDAVRFQAVSVVEAQAAAREQEGALRRLPAELLAPILEAAYHGC